MTEPPSLRLAIPELLAPAGNSAALHAAVGAGADAVYLGYGEFNARRNADNFTKDSLREACDYAHLRGVRLYATMNTIVLPHEMSRALEQARTAYGCGVDAFIVQDLGLALRLRRELPNAALHISTQMNIHSQWGLRAAAELEAKRVTLGRELSLGEIAHLNEEAQRLGLDIEVFAHGALCICCSGQCLMSSLIGGRSANRGLCAQPCRLPYELMSGQESNPSSRAPGDHLLSPKDLCIISELEGLVRTGVASLKIEGRMKSPEYVQSVVSVYRAVLDRIAAETAPPSACPTDAERSTLGSVFSRGFTSAYLTGQRGNDIMSYQRPNNRGQLVGRIRSVEEDGFTMSVSEPLAEGDLLEVWTKHKNVRIPLERFEMRGRKSVFIATDETRGIHDNDRVFRIRSAQAAFTDDPLEPRIPLEGTVRLEIGHPLEVTFSLTEASCSSHRSPSYPAPPSVHLFGETVEAARTRAVTKEDVKAHIDRLGSTPFRLIALDVVLDEGVGISFSQLHHIRAEALEALQAAMLAPYQRQDDPLRPSSQDVLGAQRPSKDLPLDEGAITIAVQVANPQCARAAKRAGASAVYVPALNFKRGQAEQQGCLAKEVSQASYPSRIIPMMPIADHDKAGEAREAKISLDVWEYASEGQPVFVESLGGLVRAQAEGMLPEVGPHLPLANADALSVARAFGATKVWLTPELNLAQIKDLATTSALPLGLKVYGAQELMVTEHCLLMSQGSCNEDCPSCPRRKVPHTLRDRKGYEFPITSDALGRSHLYNSVALDGIPAVPTLLEAGITSFMIDATLLSVEETAQAVGRLAKAVRMALGGEGSLPKQPHTTSGHLYRGVE